MAVSGDAFAIGGSFSSRNSGLTWAEFCEHQASLAAEEFSQQVSQFMLENSIASHGITRRDYVTKFVECFQRHFDGIQVCVLYVPFQIRCDC
jgi:Phenylalanine zipper